MRPWALITGASGGIGLELARGFASRGYNLVLAARRLEKLEALGKELQAGHGVEFRAFECDLASHGSAEALMGKIREGGIEMDALVNNAGFGLNGDFAALPLASQLEMARLNVLSLLELTHLCSRPMLRKRSGRILNVASTASFQPGPYMAVYYASKAFVLSFSEALGVELGAAGISVTALCPGYTRTGFQARAGVQETALARFSVLTSAQVAEAGIRGMLAGKRRVIPGVLNRLGVEAAHWLPRGFILQAVGYIQKMRK